mgnify:CR=1 FL=1
MNFWDTLLAISVFIAALIYLYRKIVRTRGCSCGSGECSVSQIKICEEQSVKKCGQNCK